MFKNKEKKEALKNLEDAQRVYMSTGRRASVAVQELYEKRKDALKIIEYAEDFLKKQPDFGYDNIKIVAEARASIRLFTENVQDEQQALKGISDPTSTYARLAMTGAGAGAAVATMGPTVAMSIATTFGTAATGTAISTLSGAAATNAALAWLGGGAVAAGGGGMAAGATILAMAGPIGLTIGAATVGIVSFLTVKKNNEIASKANKETDDIKKITSNLDKTLSKISDLTGKISREIEDLQDTLKEICKSNYLEIVVKITVLCEDINKKFTL